MSGSRVSMRLSFYYLYHLHRGSARLQTNDSGFSNPRVVSELLVEKHEVVVKLRSPRYPGPIIRSDNAATLLHPETLCRVPCTESGRSNLLRKARNSLHSLYGRALTARVFGRGARTIGCHVSLTRSTPVLSAPKGHINSVF